MKRFYRDWSRDKKFHSLHVTAKETDLQVFSSKKVKIDFLQQRIRAYRWEIETYINKDSRFLTSLKPVEVDAQAAPIVKEMSQQAKKANVGPMNTVAGAIAEFLGNDMLKAGYKEVIIENSGDIFLKVNHIHKMGVYVGRSKLWNKLQLVIKPKDTPLGISTTSGTIAHSMSFGAADSVVIISKSASLSDAVATLVANRINSKDDLQRALDFARSVKGVLGVIIILKNNLVTWGKVEFSK